MYTLYFYGSPDNKNRVTRKFKLQKNGFNKKKCSGQYYFFDFVWKKSPFFSGSGVSTPPPPDRGYFDFFEALPKGRHT